jgi:hypothetical protein
MDENQYVRHLQVLNVYGYSANPSNIHNQNVVPHFGMMPAGISVPPAEAHPVLRHPVVVGQEEMPRHPGVTAAVQRQVGGKRTVPEDEVGVIAAAQRQLERSGYGTTHNDGDTVCRSTSQNKEYLNSLSDLEDSSSDVDADERLVIPRPGCLFSKNDQDCATGVFYVKEGNNKRVFW